MFVFNLFFFLPESRTHRHTGTQTNGKSEIMNAVMKCGPEKGHWVVLSEIEKKS